MSTPKYWKLPGGRYGGITKTGKRFIVDSLSKARDKVGKATRKRKTRKNKPKTRRSRKTARRRRRNRGGNKSLARTMMKWVRIGALVSPAVANLLDAGQSTEDKFYNTMLDYTGIWIKPATGLRWQPDRLLRGWGPYLMATLMTHGIPKIGGIIRRL